MPKSDDATRARHMLQAARKALGFAQGRCRADLDGDEQFALSLVRLLEILGEAAARVTDGTRRANEEIPWAEMVGMRNRLIHGYDVVDHDVLWQTVIEDLPALIPLLEGITIADESVAE